MSNGPVIIYDKSALQNLNAAEAFVLEQHYRANVVPLFYMEVLADLDKDVGPDRNAEDLVRSIGRKVTGFGATPNVHHSTLCLGDLLGHPVEQARVPVIPGGRIIEARDGRRTMFVDEPPEAAAMRRWSAGDFLGVERDFAKGWRTALKQLDLEGLAAAIRPAGKSPLRNLAEVKAVADHMAEGRGKRHALLRFAMNVLGVPSSHQRAVIARWKACGGPPLSEFAPYAHYVLTVDLFFHLGLASRQIQSGRASHRIDIAYLYYLPFCDIFTSADGLHENVVPLFLADDQVFIRGADLKADMRKLAEYYAALPEQEKAKGAINYAAYPPRDGEYLTSHLWDRFSPGWRVHAENPIPVTPELSARIMKDLGPMIDAIEEATGQAKGQPHILAARGWPKKDD